MEQLPHALHPILLLITASRSIAGGGFVTDMEHTETRNDACREGDDPVLDVMSRVSIGRLLHFGELD